MGIKAGILRFRICRCSAGGDGSSHASPASPALATGAACVTNEVTRPGDEPGDASLLPEFGRYRRLFGGFAHD